MEYDRLLEDFIEEVKKEGTYATRDELRVVIKDMLDLIKKYKDSTPEELVEKIIEADVQLLQQIRRENPVPGVTVGVNVGNINVKMFGGDIDSMQREMPEDALFDIASMTKFYTQIIAYNLIKEGVFSLDDKISDLDDRFVNVGDLTVRDVLTFTTEFRTDGRLAGKSTIEEALDTLYKVNVVSTGAYNYTDMGMMLMKEVMEKLTGLSYDELIKEYITDKLGMTDTYLVVPHKQIERVTGSANASIGVVNDPSALSVGGYSGHAGIKTTSDDLIKLGKGFSDGIIIPQGMESDAYISGVKSNRGIMGNTYTSHEKGIDMSFVDRLEPTTNFAIQGSTRTQMNIGKNSVSTILLNPDSMGMERALEEEKKINERRAKEGKPPVSLVKHFIFDRDGKAVEYDFIDARQMAPANKTVEPITTRNAILALRLRFLAKVIEEYDKNYKKEINVTKKI